MASSLGKLLTITSFGESHGQCVGVILDGCPAGLPITEDEIQRELNQRRPNDSIAGTPRKEDDKVEILSGVFNNITTGAPICLMIRNRNIDSSVYERIRYLMRPGQSDYTAFMKYGGYNDFRGGGMFSGRITAAIVMAGAIARKLLGLIDVEILAHTVNIGGINAAKLGVAEIRANRDKSPLRCADLTASEEMSRLITTAREDSDSIGGIIEGIALNVPVGLGEPIFDAVDSELAKAILAIPAVKGIEFGAGFAAAGMKGSENNDHFELKDDKITTMTNHAGGILGGITSGMPLVLRAVFKPTPSIAKEQPTVDIKAMENTSLAVKGRHDACIVPRAVVVVEAMMALTLCDLALRAGLMPRVVK